MKQQILILLLCISTSGNLFAQSIGSLSTRGVPTDTLMFVFSLHGQTRRYQTTFAEKQDTLYLHWGIERYLKWRSGSYAMGKKSVEEGIRLSFLQPENGNHVRLSSEETVAILSLAAYKQLKENHSFVYNQTHYAVLDTDEEALGYTLIHVKDAVEGCEMWIMDNPRFRLIWRIRNNPLNINWEVRLVSHSSL